MQVPTAALQLPAASVARLVPHPLPTTLDSLHQSKHAPPSELLTRLLGTLVHGLDKLCDLALVQLVNDTDLP